MRSHPQHDLIVETLSGRDLCATAHSLAEAYSVLTRLAGDAQVEPSEAVALIDAWFPEVLTLSEALATNVHRQLAGVGVAGGAVYDALVALAAKEHDAVLVTRDARALGTYEAIKVEVEVLADTV